MAMLKKEKSRLARKSRIRKSIVGTAERPRFSVFRSSKYIYAQIVDDLTQKTIVSCSSLEKEFKSKVKSTRDLAAATLVGKEIANRAKGQKITSVVFDRNGYGYHGRIKAIADGAREAGLKF
ncbi:MAG: 50S ribosomal protein L18 [Deltaproteobacteria bacterium]|nr:50S ribosomal protein L18 [Deltaproteobacteria bacterium]